MPHHCRIQTSGHSTWSIPKTTKETVLELEAKDAEVRDKWVEEMNDALREVKDNADSLDQKALSPLEQVKAKAAKQEYWSKRRAELDANQKAAADKKKRMGLDKIGLKHTAIAMATRATAQ